MQIPVANKPPTLNNDIPTPSTATSSDSQTADHYKLIEEQQKVIASMQEKTYLLEAKLEGRINVTDCKQSSKQHGRCTGAILIVIMSYY